MGDKTPEEMAEEYIEDHDECEHAREAWLAGYHAAMANSPEKPEGSELGNSPNNSDSWVGVQDRLPELDKFVLVYGNDGSLDVRAVSERADYPWPPLWLDGWGESADYTVTHWMEIPELPKGEA